MTYSFSDFGEKLTGHSGILQLMDDLGQPLPEGVTPYRLGGGNPAQVPEVIALYRSAMENIMAEDKGFENLISLYDAPQGRVQFIETFAKFLSSKYGWKVGPENIAITNGSQSAFFYLFNLFSGTFTSKVDGSKKIKKILFPLIPEYIGYADQCIEPDVLISVPAKCEYFEDRTFKYHIDFDLLETLLSSRDDIGAMCVSRPTNPSGNVLTNKEIKSLSGLAKKYNIPLFVDNAYGLPFPNIVFTEDATPYWDESIVFSMSLSKIGLPSLRTGIIVAEPKIAQALANLNAIAALATGSVGQALAEKAIASGEILKVAETAVKPFYEKRSRQAIEWIHEFFDGSDYWIHRSEGSIFLWLYLRDLKISTKELYEKLKEQGVITVPGEHFFFGVDDPRENCHGHYDKCLRLNYSGPQDEVREGLKLLAKIYKEYV